MCPSSVQAFIEEELAPELLDFTEELLLESVDGLDFAEEELFFDEDETELPPEDVPLSVTELEEIASSPLEDEISATGSGPAPLELSSQATIAITVIKTTQK
jgi:hypothetical protein